MALDPATAAVRLAVRRSLGGLDPVLVACSGGVDSLALLAATVFEARAGGTQVIGAVVDHGLQQGSREHTARVVAQMAELGVDQTATVRVTVDPGPAGIEAGAREARYAALGQLAEHLGAQAILLGHTLDDQAETVLLGLARGSGGRSLQGMRPVFDLDGITVLRPLLEVRRTQTEASCRAEGIAWWDDPQNADPRFLRVAVRQTVLPVLETELGPGVAEALARTGEQLRTDMEFVDAVARTAYEAARVTDGVDLGLVVPADPALLTRVLRWAAIDAGAIASELSHAHVLALLGVGPGKEIQLPGHVTGYRSASEILFRRTGTGDVVADGGAAG